MQTLRTCHTNWRSMTPSTTPATQDEGGYGTPATRTGDQCFWLPRLPHKEPRHKRESSARHQSQPSAIRARLPHKVKVDVAKCHACHTEWKWMLSSAACHRLHVDASKCSACHTEWRWVLSSATSATQKEGWCRQVPRLLPIATPKRRGDKPNRNQARHQSQPTAKSLTPATKWRSMSRSATPATQNGGGCFQLPHLPHKMKVDVAKCHACHTKSRGDKRGLFVSELCVRVVCEQVVCVWESCVWASCVWESCVWASCVWVSCVWESSV